MVNLEGFVRKVVHCLDWFSFFITPENATVAPEFIAERFMVFRFPFERH